MFTRHKASTFAERAIHRLRRRHQELLDEEIAHTVSTVEEIEEERRHLRQALIG
jgi:hypothetical protein